MLSSFRKPTQTLHELTFCSQELFDLYFIKFDEYSLSLKTHKPIGLSLSSVDECKFKII